MLHEATAMTVRQRLGELLNEVQYRHSRIVITKAGKPVAAIVDMATLESLRKREDDSFDQLWRRVAKNFEDVPAEELDAEIDRAVEEVRAERHRARTAAMANKPKKLR